MVQQYYSLEEAAKVLGTSAEEVNRIRERGEVRAFADRGTWKFRVKDIEELARQRGTGSDSSVPLGADLSDSDDGEQVLLSEQELGSSDSSSPSTVIGMGAGAPSDSDVRLVPDMSSDAGSDSDVKLVSEEGRPASDSDVKLVESQAEGSDSDVRVEKPRAAAPGPRADEGSDFELSGSGSTLDVGQESKSGPSDSSLVLGGVGDSEISIAPSDSGISLASPSDSGISLEQPPDLSVGVKASVGAGADLLETDFEVPLLEEPAGSATEADLEIESDFDLTPVGAQPDSGSQVIAVEGEEEVDAAAATTVADASSAIMEDLGSGALEAVEEGEAFAEPSAVPLSEEEIAVAPMRLTAQELEWGRLVVGGLGAATLLMFLVSFMMFDLVHNMWSVDQPSQFSSFFIGLFKGIFG